MQMRTIEIVVGAFMLAGLISLAVLAIRVSGCNVGAATNTNSVYAKFEIVGGVMVLSAAILEGARTEHQG